MIDHLYYEQMKEQRIKKYFLICIRDYLLRKICQNAAFSLTLIFP